MSAADTKVEHVAERISASSMFNRSGSEAEPWF